MDEMGEIENDKKILEKKLKKISREQKKLIIELNSLRNTI